MDDDTGTIDAPSPAPGPQREPARGNLAPIALGLGIGGLLLGLVPFYGFFLALPLSIVAVVLGLTARGRPEESRGQATGGLVTGGLGLVAVVGWAVWFAWGQFGGASFVSQTSVEVGAEEAVGMPPAPEASPAPPPGPSPESDAPLDVRPPAPGGGLVEGLSGRAELTVDGRDTTLELTSCALAEQTRGGVLLRADGPDGRVAAARPGGVGSLVLDVEVEGGPQGTYLGDVRGLSSSGSSGGLFGDRREFSLTGQVRELHGGEVVELDLTVTCG